MILSGGRFAVFVASKPVDFRKGMDGLAAVVQQQLRLDPFCGAVFVFRRAGVGRGRPAPSEGAPTGSSFWSGTQRADPDL